MTTPPPEVSWVAQTTAVRPDRNLNERAMADCEETLRELEAFLDGELDVDDLSLVRSHIDGCMDCLQAYDFYAELRVVIKQKCREQEVPPGLLDRVKSCFGDDAAEVLERPPQGPFPTSA
jgi:anti-sigma factor (TIGR02949 family)